MRSMTGFGRGNGQADGREMTVEVRSVNARYLDINCRMPHALSRLDGAVRRLIGEALKRGKVDLYLNYKNVREDRNQLQVDTQLAQNYVMALEALSLKLEMENTAGLVDVVGFPGIFTMHEMEEDIPAVNELLETVLMEALGDLILMREKEGKNIAVDLTEKMAIIEKAVAVVEMSAPQIDRKSVV